MCLSPIPLRRSCFLVASFLLVAPYVVGDPGSEEGQRWAVFFACNEYKSSSIPDLKGTHNDVDSLSTVLIRSFGFSKERMRIVRDEEATRAGILAVLNHTVREVGPQDTLYVHFSGHGSQVKDSGGDEGKDDGLDETILPHDARTPGVADITDDELGEIFSRLKSQSVLIVLDSCHSGTATRGLTGLQVRSVPPDTRLDLYARSGTRAVVPIESRYVLMTGAAAHQSALDGPVDGKFYGLFSYSLSRALAQMKPGATPRHVFPQVERELRRVQDLLGRRTMPEPQLEASEDRLTKPLFASSATQTRHPKAVARRPWLYVKPLDERTALLVDGTKLWGSPGSLWGIYPPGERRFQPGRAMATARVTENRDGDSVLRIVSRVKTVKSIPPASRAVSMGAPSPAPVAVRFDRVPAEERKKLSTQLSETLGDAVRVAASDEFAQYVVDKVSGKESSKKWRLTAASGSTQEFEEKALGLLTTRLQNMVVRSRNVSELLTMENPASALELSVDVHRPAPPGRAPQRIGERGIRIVADVESPSYRIRRSGEPRTSENSLQIRIQTNADCYVTIVDVDSEGSVQQLFPNAAQGSDFYPDGWIPGSQTAVIPDSLEVGNSARFFFDYSPPSGEDAIRVFACTDLETAMILRENIGLASAETGTRGLQPNRSLRSALRGLNRPRGIVVVPARTEEDIEVIDAELYADFPTEFIEEYPFEDADFDAAELPFEDFAVEYDGEEGDVPAEGDWTAASITIFVSES